jgi:hypothetical protein
MAVRQEGEVFPAKASLDRLTRDLDEVTDRLGR